MDKTQQTIPDLSSEVWEGGNVFELKRSPAEEKRTAGAHMIERGTSVNPSCIP
jgi:hypothetical protein